jgi:antitoxin MazE
MRTKIQKWGNSLSVRIPKTVAEQAGLKEQDPLDIEVEGHKVVLLPRTERDYRLRDLLKGVTKKNLHKQIDFGSPVGRELL